MNAVELELFTDKPQKGNKNILYFKNIVFMMN